ncbi:MAG: tRNA pseudouridine(55) synthase TruB [Candidatus Cloacimonas sp.]
MPLANNGFIAIDKPEGISSFAVIKHLRKITGLKKIGHSGTLDPFASGLVICCLGQYTRLAAYPEKADKTYLAVMKLGTKTTTGDPEGEIIQTAPIPDWENKLANLEKQALLLTELSVPAYSAVKINGIRAYALARKGISVELPRKQIKIIDFSFLCSEQNPADELCYRCQVSKGTYIRALSEWLAEQLNTLAYTKTLRRERVGKITLQDAVKLDNLTSENWFTYRLDYKQVFPQWAYQNLEVTDFDKVMNGIDIAADSESNENVLLLYEDNICAVGKRINDLIHPFIVLK